MKEFIESVKKDLERTEQEHCRVNEDFVRTLVLFANEGHLDGIVTILKKYPSMAKDISESFYTTLLRYCEEYKGVIDESKRVEAVKYILESVSGLVKSLDDSALEKMKFNKHMIILLNEIKPTKDE